MQLAQVFRTYKELCERMFRWNNDRTATVEGEPCILLASSHMKKTIFIQDWIEGQEATALRNVRTPFE